MRHFDDRETGEGKMAPTWGMVKSAAENLLQPEATPETFDRHWTELQNLARQMELSPPMHIAQLLDALTALTGDRERAHVDILDHGCGGGLTVLFLIALGWRGARGVDIKHGERFARLNAAMRDAGIVSDTIFREFGGGVLAFEDESFDFIFSQQVIEHVNDQSIELYYAEEGRTLKQGGRVYHQIPHRLVPYDTHTKTWLIHYLPRKLQRPFYRLAGWKPDHIQSFLFLRTPRFHNRRIKKHIGTPQNMASRRMISDVVEHKHHKGLRNLMAMLYRSPVIGHLLRPVILSVVMLELTASSSK